MLDDVVARLRAAGCVWADDEAALLVAQAPDPDALDSLVARRCGGEPLERVLGWAELLGVRVPVSPASFVPRRRSEPLLRAALALIPSGARRTVVDVGCGSGALGLVVHTLRPDVVLHGTEVDTAAAAAASQLLGTGIVHVGDLLDPLPASLLGQIDVVLANLPYVPTARIATLPREARDHDPRISLDGGDDGLRLHRRLAARVSPWLGDGGTVLAEVSPGQAPACAAAYAAQGLRATAHTDDDHDVAVVTARGPARVAR